MLLLRFLPSQKVVQLPDSDHAPGVTRSHEITSFRVESYGQDRCFQRTRFNRGGRPDSTFLQRHLREFPTIGGHDSLVDRKCTVCRRLSRLPAQEV